MRPFKKYPEVVLPSKLWDKVYKIPNLNIPKVTYREEGQPVGINIFKESKNKKLNRANKRAK